MEEVEDYTLHEPPTPETIENYNRTGKDGPDSEDLCIDMRGKISSKWNEEVIRILATACINHQAASEAYSDLPKRSLGYYIDIVKSQLERGRHAWRSAQPKAGYDGVESILNTEQRLVEAKERKLRRGRKHSRRLAVSQSCEIGNCTDNIPDNRNIPEGWKQSRELSN